MAMPIPYAISTSFRKLGRRKVRTFFGIAPTTALLIFIVLFSSVSTSINYFIKHKVLEKIEVREEVLHLQRFGSFGGATFNESGYPGAPTEESLPIQTLT